MFLLFFQFLDSILDIRTDTALKGKSHEKPLFQANWHICILQPEKSNFPRLSCCWTLTKGSILVECGHALQTIGKYEVKVFNTINFSKSMHYNPFAYIHSEKDILKLVTTLIANTKGDGPLTSSGPRRKPCCTVRWIVSLTMQLCSSCAVKASVERSWRPSLCKRARYRL